MADIRTTLCGIEIDSPFVLASGPVGFSAEGLIAAANAGCGAVTTKTISYNGVVNTTRHMVTPGSNMLINNEGGSDMTLDYWLKEIPMAKAGGVKCLIASVGGIDVDACIDIGRQVAAAGADILEVVVDYHNPGSLVSTIREIKAALDLPILVKVNANWKNTTEMAELCAEAGADGVTAIDSMGPTLRLNLATGRPLLGGKAYGYLTGAPILPFSLRIVNEIASGSKEKLELVGTGGVMSGRDALEMLLAGGTCVGICTYPIIMGVDKIAKLCSELSAEMDKYGYKCIADASRKAVPLDKLPEKSVADFTFDAAKCNNCGRCVTVCAYRARTLDEGRNTVDASLCRICGLCVSACPTKAIKL